MSDLTIGAVMEVLGGEYFGGILGGIARVAENATLGSWCSAGHRTTLPPRISRARSGVDRRSFAPWAAALARLGLPLVTVAYHDPEVGYPAVVADNRQGVREAVRHLIAHGHRRIAFIGWLEYPAIADGTRVIATRGRERTALSPDWSSTSRTTTCPVAARAPDGS